MASKLGSHGQDESRRAFVLVDKDIARGVFRSWDDAEDFANENNFSLDNLLEFETKKDYPDHLHLMAAKWGAEWKFVGEWSKFAPYWESAPSQIRLDHYHVKGGEFVIFRQCEFTWRPGLLQTINPMAPDEALRFSEQAKPKQEAPGSEQRSKISPLKPIGGFQKTEPDSKPETPEKAGKPPLIGDPEPPVESIQPKPKLSTTASGTSQTTEQVQKESAPDTPAAKISFQKKKPLRLKSQKAGPKPIPEFKPPPPPPVGSSDAHASSVELAQAQLAAESNLSGEGDATAGKPRKIWPIRVLLPIFAIFICWGGGVFWVFKPEPTAQKILDQVTTLSRARVLVIEPGQIFFQLPVDPINQQRWVQSLGLDPISETEPFSIPTYHALDTWQKSSGFVRPPYAAVEVREWWNLRLRTIRYGFYHEWEDGSILILDLESDFLIGWSYASRLPDLLN